MSGIGGIQKGIYRAMFAMALPVMVEEGLQTLVSYVDTAMVGSLGAAASAAVGVTQTSTWLIWGLLRAASIGLISYISQAVGRRDQTSPHKAGAQGIMMSLVIGAVITVLSCSIAFALPKWLGADESIHFMAGQYFFILSIPTIFRSLTINLGAVLRSTGNMRTPMLVNVVVNAINIVLNFFLIYPTREISVFDNRFTVWGAGWGVKGAAIASAVGVAVGGVLMLLAVLRNDVVSPRGYSLKPDRPIMKYCAGIALPAGAQHVIITMGFVMFSALVTSLGTTALAAHVIANTAEQAFYIPAYGLQSVAATMIGVAVGEENEPKMDEIAKLFFWFPFFLLAVLGAFLFRFATPVMGIFTEDAQVIAMGAVVLRIVAVAEPFFGTLTVFEGLLRGVGNIKPTVFVAVSCMWGIRILFTFLCVKVFGLGLNAAWLCMSADNVGRFIVYAVIYKTGRWKSTVGFLKKPLRSEE